MRHSMDRFGVIDHNGRLEREYNEVGGDSIALWKKQKYAERHCVYEHCKAVVTVCISWEEVNK